MESAPQGFRKTLPRKRGLSPLWANNPSQNDRFAKPFGKLGVRSNMTLLTKPVRRVTREAFFNYGPDRDRPFVVTLAPGDVLILRPTRRKASAEITIKLADIYRYALQCRVNCARLEKARAVKKRKEERRKLRALDRQIWLDKQK